MILRYLFYGFLIYMAYRLIFHFIIPVYKTTRQVKRQFRDVHDRMQEQFNGNSPNAAPQYKSTTTESTGQKTGEYIDFEEIKEK